MSHLALTLRSLPIWRFLPALTLALAVFGLPGMARAQTADPYAVRAVTVDITAANSPRIFLQDGGGHGSEAFTLVSGQDRIPAGQWTRVKLAFDGKVEKAMRWLGFVQGTLWLLGVYSIDEMRAQTTEAGIGGSK